MTDIVQELRQAGAINSQRMRLAAAAEIERLRSENAALRAASELSLGILWMIEDRNGKVRDAHTVLLDALGKEGLKRGIAAAIGRGYEAEHPSGADWWAGKRP